MKQLLIYQISSQRGDTQDFDTRWGQALPAASEIPKENVLESLYKMRIRESVQLRTVLAMYEQEIERDLEMPSFQRLNEDYGKKRRMIR